MRTFFFIAVLAFPAFLSAHASMESLYATEGEYLIDVGYDPVEPQVGRRFLIDIALREGSETGPLVDFDSVWVRISRDRATYFATGVARSAFGPTTLVMELPAGAEGPMTLSLRFEKGSEAIAEHSFDLTVAPPERAITKREYALGGIALVATVIAIYVSFSRKRYAQAHSHGAILTE